MSNAIRLTNKTAIALRKSAMRMRTMYYTCAAAISVAMAALAVYWGLKWLPAVPLTVAAAVAIDVMIVMHARSVYLTMIGQAICTEAAAREIRAGQSETRRREKAITDLIDAKADAQRAMNERETAACGAKPLPFHEKEDKKEDEKEEEDEADSAKENAQDTAMPRRRRRSDGLKLIRGEQAK